MSKIKIINILIISAVLSSFFLLSFIGNKLNKKIYNYINLESTRLVSNVVNYSVNQIIEENIKDDIFEITKNNRGEVELLDYDTKEVNRLLKVINQSIQKELIQLEEGKIKKYVIAENFKQGRFKNTKSGIICEIPLGILRENILFANFGPYIPIRMSFLGSVRSYINTKITSYGFNSLVLEANIHIEVDEKVTMPTSSKISTLKVKAPLTLKVIQGIIPEYYYTKGIEKTSNQYSINE